MEKIYKSEIEGMQDFWQELEILPDYSCNTDGKIDGILFEMKLEIKSYSTVEKQIKRYIRAYNALALPIPSKAIALDINQRKYNLYNVSTSKDGDTSLQKLKTDVWTHPKDFKNLIDSTLNQYSKGWICESSIASYNNVYCRKHKKASKENVKQEFINPQEIFIYPFDWDMQISNEITDRSYNNWLTFNMNLLGNSLLKKQLGAFFTPDKYVKISTEYLKKCIETIKSDGYEYVIIDTCAGTGNLQKFFESEWLQYTILSTYDYTEWTTLNGIYEGRVKMIIPHTNEHRNEKGLLLDGNALNKEFNDYLLDWLEKNIDREKCKIIMIENPPFAEPQGNASKGKETFSIINIYMYREMGQYRFSKKNANRELANLFIWKAFNVMQADYYIVYSPIKYWKSQHIIDKTFIAGHCCNRKNFNASEGCISLILWENKDTENQSLTLTNDFYGSTKIEKQFKNPSELLIDSKNRPLAYFFNLSNIPKSDNGKLVNDIDNYAGYRKTQKAYRLGEDNILQQLPLWVANCYECNDYTEMDVIMKSADGGNIYQSDREFLQKCFIWSCISKRNVCISNENLTNNLCLYQDTEADKLLQAMDIDDADKILLSTWNKLLIKVKTKEEYNSQLKYGLFQIDKDINIGIPTGRKSKTGKMVMVKKYGNTDDIDDMVKQLKDKLKEYRAKHIEEKLFEYQLLK
ncbi:MAG: hypothetical protein HAW62_03610 [Endozoicomonadaceae bacterium]|nr:hypothetical protein [Endozoicomonadaceae bacterium]